VKRLIFSAEKMFRITGGQESTSDVPGGTGVGCLLKLSVDNPEKTTLRAMTASIVSSRRDTDRMMKPKSVFIFSAGKGSPLTRSA